MVKARDNPVAQSRSRTAMIGYLAAAAAGESLDRMNLAAWFERHGFAIRDRGLRDALKRRLRRQGEGLPADGDPAEWDCVRDGVDFNATRLDLDFAVVSFPGAERPEQLLDVLRKTERVVRLYHGYERDLVALVVYDGVRERERLQTLLEEHEPRLRWVVIRDIDDTLAAPTWLSLARRVAAEEGLLTP
jgi:hypothetical protein